MRLRDHEWWPKVWDSISSEEIRLHGILKNCPLSRQGLTLVVDYEGQSCNGLISSESWPRLDLAKLHHFSYRIMINQCRKLIAWIGYRKLTPAPHSVGRPSYRQKL